MNINEELKLVIKSKYPVIYCESIDEAYTLRQLKSIAMQLNLDFYQWSLTEGLGKGDNVGSYYDTKVPVKMLRMVIFIIKQGKATKIEQGKIEEIQIRPSLFVLKDFERCLEDPLAVRLFKDAINLIRKTQNTFVILSAGYKLPKDIEPDSAHLIGGYPVEDEILNVIEETAVELRRTNKKIELALNYVELENIIRALKGLSIQQIRNIINQCLLDDGVLNAKDFNTIESYKKKLFDQEGLLEFCLTEDKNNIAGFSNLKRWLSERKDAFTPTVAKASNLPTPKGLLLMGVQGCGKSLAVKVIARELNLPLYRLDLASLYSKYIGETEQNLRKALMLVEKLSPICLWVDEIEKGFAASGGDIDGGVSQRILGTFLTWMQERKASSFLAATANDVYLLPPEFLRKGRFDEIFFVDLPDAQSRELLFKIHLQKRRLKPEDFDLKRLAAKGVGFSGAEIEQAIISALYRASSEKEAVATEHIIEQIKSTKPLSVLKGGEIAALRDWAKGCTVSV